jgi:hypothetical protein
MGDEATIKVATPAPYFVSGALLQQMCSADEKKTNGPQVCENYIAGVVDTIASNRDTIQGYQICLPRPGPDLKTLRIMLVKYLGNHPEMLNGIGASIFDTMLFDSYPCPGAKPPSGDQFIHKN